ncbi:alpha/beta hydrolase [Ectopseudomonas khazarica]|uniref:Alpha/beta hydrolase n=1 Tax=Ectopseudomonas khazarica TaxID=2502979 RepID=A0ABW7M7D5_9GAMM
MPLDPQIAAILSQFSSLPAPTDVVSYREAANCLIPPFPAPELPEVRDMHVAGAAGPLDARLYRPKAEDGLPLLVYFHGGGFVIGSLDTHDYLCRSLALLTGAVVVSVAYRLAPENKFPAAPLDCYHATCDLCKRATELGVDASRLALAGDSAGGNMSIAVARQAAAADHPQIAAIGLLYPATDGHWVNASGPDLPEGYFLSGEHLVWFWQNYLQTPAQATDPLASPLLAEDLHRLPPTTLWIAEYDLLRDEEETFAVRLREAGVKIRSKCCEGMIHGFASMAPLSDRAAAELEEFAAELRQALN